MDANRNIHFWGVPVLSFMISLPIFTARAELARGSPSGPLEVHDMSNAAFGADTFDLN